MRRSDTRPPPRAAHLPCARSNLRSLLPFVQWSASGTSTSYPEPGGTPWMADWNGDKERPQYLFLSQSCLPVSSPYLTSPLVPPFFHSLVFIFIASSFVSSYHLLIRSCSPPLQSFTSCHGIPALFLSITYLFVPALFVILISHFFLPPSFATMSRPHPFLVVCFLQWFYFLPTVAE